MTFAKKTWTDRVAEFINRRILTKEDGSAELVTVARSEGNISVEGDAFNAETMNDLEQRIANGFDSVNNDLANTNSAVSELNTNLDKKVNDESFDSHKNSSDHDGRYYTESEINTLLNGKAPIGHASTGTGYGVGTIDKWGHIRIVNGFTHSQYFDGYALSGYAGYLLKKEIDAITESPTWNNTNTSGKSTDVMYSRKAGIGFVLCTSAPHHQVAANTWVTLGNIPDGYRPTQNTPFVGAYGSLPIIGYVYTNGNIVIYSTTAIPTTGNAICFNVSYPLA